MTATLKREASRREAPGRNVVAYIGYDSGLRPSSGRTRSRPVRARFAWERLAVMATSLLAWVGIIAAARAIF
jgi:hypothetical protein